MNVLHIIRSLNANKNIWKACCAGNWLGFSLSPQWVHSQSNSLQPRKFVRSIVVPVVDSKQNWFESQYAQCLCSLKNKKSNSQVRQLVKVMMTCRKKNKYLFLRLHELPKKTGRPCWFNEPLWKSSSPGISPLLPCQLLKALLFCSL